MLPPVQLQRVVRADVTVDGVVVGSIGQGLLCLVGLCRTDTMEDCKWIAGKILGTRLFPGGPEGNEQWKSSVAQIGGGVLLVSQFTLFAVTKVRAPACA